MSMNRIYSLAVNGLVAMVALAAVPLCHADDKVTTDGARILGVVSLQGASVTPVVYRSIDRLVPDLKKLAKDKIVKLECHYNGKSDREQDVLNAYMLAARVDKYLRERHKLELDLWIATHIGTQARGKQAALTFAVFADEIGKLDRLPVDPAKPKAE